MTENSPTQNEDSVNDDRRQFLSACGKFAAVTPPAITLLLSTSLTSKAIAHSGGRPDHDGGRGGGDFWEWLERLFGKLF